MTTKTVVCPTCDASLNAGRFTCPTCGTLVAAVATAIRPLSAAERDAYEQRIARVRQGAVADPAAVEPAVADPAAVEPAVAEPAAAKPVVADSASTTAAVAQRIEPEPQPAAPAELAEPSVPHPAPAADERVERAPAPRTPRQRVRPRAEVATAPLIPDEPDRPVGPWITGIDEVLASAAPASTVAATAPGPSWPTLPSWPPPPTEAPPDAPAVRVPAGLYLPPSAVLPPGDALPLSSTNGPHHSAAPAISSRTQPGTPTEKASIRLSAVVGARVLAAGASIAALGFFLPWANFIIGSARNGGWIDQLGFAGSGHPALLPVLLAIAAVGVTAERLPTWVRPGVPAIAIGGLLLGIAWPYIFGAYGAWTGIYVVTLGALLLIAGGWLDLRSSRHAGQLPPV